MKINFFEESYPDPLRNLVNVKRFSGKFLIKPESVPDHLVDMFSICRTLVEFLSVHSELRIDIRDISYRIFTHDADEALICDVPRSLKYYSENVTEALGVAVTSMLNEKYPARFVNDIENSKDVSNINGLIVKLADVIQARYKIYEEAQIFGNRSFDTELDNSEKFMREVMEKVKSLIYYTHEVRTHIGEILLNILNKTKKDEIFS